MGVENFNRGVMADDLERSLEIVRGELSALRFGSIELIVHEGRVVQIDTTRKHRLAPRG